MWDLPFHLLYNKSIASHPWAIAVLIVVSHNVQCQEADTLSNSYFIGVKAHTGFIIPHSKEIIDVSSSKPYGFQIDASRINRSQKAWNKCNCYSQVGLSLAYFNYGDPEVLGSSYNLIAYMEPLLSYNKRLDFRFRTGAGLTYLTKCMTKFQIRPTSFSVRRSVATSWLGSQHIINSPRT